ncbi:MAG: CFI-box-CTERM domain-containing protein [Candidatus Hadarchaeaceae archaeon]
MAKKRVKESADSEVKHEGKGGKEKFNEVDPRTLISVPMILCPVCGLPMEIKGRKEVEKTARTLRGKTTRKIPHLIYRCTKDRTEFNLNLERRGGGCFIATAAYGTSMAHEINVLRSFRDNYLMRESTGRIFISMYYRVSPAVARLISKSQLLKFITRTLLLPIIKVVQRKLGP